MLGPFLYAIYSSELGPLLTAHAVRDQLYADDIHTYLHCLTSNAMAAVRALILATGAMVAVLGRYRLDNIPRTTYPASVLVEEASEALFSSTQQILVKKSLN